MPQSRKRPGHHPYRKPSDIPARQRTKGRYTLSVLFGVFGLLIALFSAGPQVLLLVMGTLVGALIGYFIGKNMEKQATH